MARINDYRSRKTADNSFFTLINRLEKSTWDKWLFFVVIILSGIGLLAVYESSASISLRDFSDQYYYVKEQMKWYGIGTVLMVLISIIPYKRFYGMAVPMMIAAIVFLIAVFMPYVGVRAYGANRWINLGFINFQPAEFVKLSLILYLAAWFTEREKVRFISFIILVLFLVGLIILEPDLGTAIVILSIAVLMYFFSGASFKHLLYFIPLAVAGITATALLAPYRLRRITTFLNPEADPLGASYQIRQILFALGSGGWFGVGIGKSRQKYAYLPEANTDSIFAIIGEEIGFIGSVAVISLFFILIWRGFRIAQNTEDPFGRFLALGIVSWIGIQTIINLSSAVALVPLTGIPLPFISYGGSSLTLLFCAIGILLSISRYGKYEKN